MSYEKLLAHHMHSVHGKHARTSSARSLHGLLFHILDSDIWDVGDGEVAKQTVDTMWHGARATMIPLGTRATMNPIRDQGNHKGLPLQTQWQEDRWE
jgi:hypothetical protein